MKRCVIYTALTGSYDALMQPDDLRADCDYICFSSDIQDKQIGVWQIRAIPYANPDPTRTSRCPKLNPHLVLSEYEASLYVDANVKITSELNRALDRVLESGAICAMVPHGERTSVYSEGFILMLEVIGEPDLLYRQIRDLLKSRFPHNTGLYACSLLFRMHNDHKVRAFSEAWWRDYSTYCRRDQMSVMPALAEAGVQPAMLIENDYLVRNTVLHRQRPPKARPNFIQQVLSFFPRRMRVARLLILYAFHGIPLKECFEAIRASRSVFYFLRKRLLRLFSDHRREG